MLGLHFCARAFSSCGKRGPLFIAVRGPLTITASLVAEHRLQTHRLSSCGSWAQLLRGMWDLPRPGLEPVSPALAGRFSTTEPPGKPWQFLKKWKIHQLHDSVIPLLAIYPRKTKAYGHSKTCMWLFIAALSVIAKNWKQHKCPLTGEWINNLWHIHTVEYYSAIQRKELLIHATRWMNLKIIMVSERSQTKMSIFCMTLRI